MKEVGFVLIEVTYKLTRINIIALAFAYNAGIGALLFPMEY